MNADGCDPARPHRGQRPLPRVPRVGCNLCSAWQRVTRDSQHVPVGFGQASASVITLTERLTRPLWEHGSTPAAHTLPEQLEYQGREQCHHAGGVTPGDDGRIVRISLADHDRRIFVPTPYGSPSWERGYNRRSALTRINNRIDNSFSFERHFIRGLAKMQTRVGVALAVMMAMALGQVNKAGRPEQMRSLVQPIPATG